MIRHEQLFIQGMDSPDCAHVIEHSLMHLPGVVKATVSYASQQLSVEFDSEKIKLSQITARIGFLGYSARASIEEVSFFQENYELILSLLAGVLLAFGWFFNFLPLILFSYLCGGIFTFRDSIQTLLQKRFDIDVLMIVAALGAAILGDFAEGALLLFLFSLGHSLEHKALERARHAVTALAQLTPKTALVEREGQCIEIKTDDLLREDLVIVKPGQHIPCDGIVLNGQSNVNQAPITGESIPVAKTVGDEVFAGTINGQGKLTVIVKKLAAESTLSRMVRLVLEANTQKSPTERFTDQFVKYFVPSVILLVLGMIFIPPFLGETWSAAFYRAMAMLVAASPCALAIATPASVLSAVTRAARNGVLFKGGMHLENLSRVHAIAFDKTGTLTQGKPRVTALTVIDGTMEELLRYAASLEKMSDHPLGRAIAQKAQEAEITLQAVTQMQAINGKGITGYIDNQLVKIGSLSLFSDVPANILELVQESQLKGDTVMLVQVDQKWLGIISVADTIRSEAQETLAKIQQLGIQHTIMLTGDHQGVADAIAKQVGITEVKAGLLPEEKLSAITTLTEQYKYTAMVGDGINDAPAMARATVGIAMSGAGSDVALEAADIALMADDLSKLPFAITLARKAERIIRQNLWLSLGVVGLLLIATAFDFAGIGLAVLIHEGSTLVVVANALRLLK